MLHHEQGNWKEASLHATRPASRSSGARTEWNTPRGRAPISNQPDRRLAWEGTWGHRTQKTRLAHHESYIPTPLRHSFAPVGPPLALGIRMRDMERKEKEIMDGVRGPGQICSAIAISRAYPQEQVLCGLCAKSTKIGSGRENRAVGTARVTSRWVARTFPLSIPSLFVL